MQEASTTPPEILQLIDAHPTLKRFFDAQQSRLDYYQVEYEKVSRLLAAQLRGHRKETHISSHEQQWLPFTSQEERDRAKAEAEADAQQVIDDHANDHPPAKKKRRSEGLPKHLPVLDRVFDVPEAERVCPVHGPMKCIGCDETETLVLEPPKLYCIHNKYMKYACSCCTEQGVVSPERPTGLVEGNKYDASVAAAVVADKYDYHLPLNRQVDSFAGMGWTPSRSTLANLLRQTCFVVEPFVSYMAGLVKQDHGFGLDETSCRMLLPKETPVVKPGDLKSLRLAAKIAEARAKNEDSILAKMWAYGGLDRAPYNIFDFRVSRHRDGPAEFLKDSRGYVQGDCFSGNLAVVLESDGRLKFSACWAHARRYAVECADYRADCDLLLDMIQALYTLEERAANMSIEERYALRQREAVPVLCAIRAWLDTKTEQEVLPKSGFAAVVTYFNNNWEALIVYAETGFLPIDNNAIERLMKQIALGRKNWLFVGNVEAGERAAMLMSLVSSAKRHDLDVWTYVKDVLERLLAGETNYASLLPDVWKQSHPEAVRMHRVEERRDKAQRKKLARAKRVLKAKQRRAVSV